MTECPRCGSDVSWRNHVVRCARCGREYCKECPDYRGGRFVALCPDCGSREGKVMGSTPAAPDRAPPEPAS